VETSGGERFTSCLEGRKWRGVAKCWWGHNAKKKSAASWEKESGIGRWDFKTRHCEDAEGGEKKNKNRQYAEEGTAYLQARTEKGKRRKAKYIETTRRGTGRKQGGFRSLNTGRSPQGPPTQPQKIRRDARH